MGIIIIIISDLKTKPATGTQIFQAYPNLTEFEQFTNFVVASTHRDPSNCVFGS
jgi:hypothetical protein